MGAKASTTQPRVRTYSNSGQSDGISPIAAHPRTSQLQTAMTLNSSHDAGTSGLNVNGRSRARSLGSVQNGGQSAHGVAGANSSTHQSQDSDSSSPDEPGPISRGILQFHHPPHSLPVQLISFHGKGIKCPVCSKFVPPDDIECHLVMCLTKPKISYNEDVLMEDKDECIICFDDLTQGDTIARLPCLCIYHKKCIDDWFKVNRSCPEHPVD